MYVVNRRMAYKRKRDSEAKTRQDAIRPGNNETQSTFLLYFTKSLILVRLYKHLQNTSLVKV